MFLNFKSSNLYQRLFGSDPDHYMNAIDISQAEPDEDDWIRIVPTGEFPEHRNGAHVVTEEHIKQMAENFRNSGTDLLFDIDHASLFGNTKAAAWSTKVDARSDGLYIKYPEFTPHAEEAIENREYRYFSPVYKLDEKGKQGELIGAVIDSVAITNRPYMDNEIDHIGNTAVSSPESDESSQQSKSNDMKLNKESLEKLGLSEDATEEEINEAIANSDINPEKDESEEQEEPKINTDQGEKSDYVKSLEAKVNSLIERLDEKEEKEQENRAEALINSAIDNGKINPADKDAWLTAAKASYANTKEALDKREKNSVMPGNMNIDEDAGNGDTKVNNNTEQCADFIRAQMQ